VSKRQAAGETVIVEVARSDSLVIAELPPSGVVGDVELCLPRTTTVLCVGPVFSVAVSQADVITLASKM
jgi:hypothetical protein